MLNIAAGNPITGYNLTRSLRFRSSATAWLGRTPASTTNQTTWTFSAWVKRGTLTTDYPTLFSAAQDGNNLTAITFYDTSTSYINFVYVVGGVDTVRISTTQVFRDPSAWYHIVAVADTTNATASNRMRLYVNGSQVTAFSYASYPAQNTNLWVNSANYHGIGITRAVGRYYDGQIAEVNFIDGQALTPSSFGSYNSTTGVWQPAPYTGTYGTNGFYLPFTDNSALTTSSNVGLGKDFSGNGNYWTTNNISITAGATYDSMTDVPTLTSATAANFAVLNPLFKSTNQSTPSNGNLTITGNGGGNFYGGLTSSIFVPVNSGKFYWEFKAVGLFTTNGYFAGGIATNNYVPTNNGAGTYNPGGTAAGAGTGMNFYPNNTGAELSLNGSVSALNATYAVGDVMNFALDTATGKFWIGKNGTWLSSGNPAAGTNQIGTITGGTSYAPWFGCYTSTDVWSGTFGQQPFTYTPPTGYVALNTYNLPTSTIVKGNTVMDATLYTGNGSTQTITNAAGFKPDFVWIKRRDSTNYHILTDSVRGTNSQLFSNDTLAQESRTDRLTAFNSNGFSLGTYVDVNNSTSPFVGWQWQAGQGSTSSNTSGTITSTVSVNASAGFSVVTYTGTGVAATVGHGLGVAPSMVIVKQRNATQDWMVGSSALTSWNQYLILNAVQQAAGSTTVWNDTAPTSSVFSLGNSATTNGNTNTYVAYCWAPISGYSSIGKYTGNGVAAGTFVYTGFQPKFILIKSSSTTYAWFMEDSARNVYNGISSILQANSSAAEITGTTYNIDFLSNGFKLATPQGNINGSGDIFIYMAFASNPFKNSLAF